MAAYAIRTMSAAELALAADWAAAEGWNPGLDDPLAFHAADPDGFLVGTLDGAPVASISVVRYGAGFGFLGFYIVAPAQRGRGYGLMLWQAGMDRLAGRNVGLDGVVAQQDNYRRSGFRLAWRNVRHQGVLAQGGAPSPAGVTVVDAKTLPFSALAAYDRRFFPAPRPAFLSLWTGLPRHVAVAAVADGALAGLAVLRPCRTGCKIGPLYARDAGIAVALVGALAPHAGDAPIALDVPDFNAAAVRLAGDLGLAPAFETARMYTGSDPAIDRDALFGVTTFELG